MGWNSHGTETKVKSENHRLNNFEESFGDERNLLLKFSILKKINVKQKCN